MPSIDSSDNYSGHFVDGYFDKKRFIVAEGPQESTSAKFWQVVWDEDCSLVVMLTPQDSELVSREREREREREWWYCLYGCGHTSCDTLPFMYW